tara:strand:+ start:1036 stop:1254 length:219 start_codon:yes stop_codon:yes gene_type:complete
LFLSIFGFIIFLKKNKKSILIYLFSISVILEIFHLFIPKRSFELSDLTGNILGVILAFTLFNTYSYVKKNFI